MRENTYDKEAKKLIDEQRRPKEGNANIALVKADKKNHCLYAETAYNLGKNDKIYPWRWHANDTPFGMEVNNGWVMYLDLNKIDEEGLEDALLVLTGKGCWIGVDTSDFQKEMNGSEESNYSFEYDDVRKMFGFI